MRRLVPLHITSSPLSPCTPPFLSSVVLSGSSTYGNVHTSSPCHTLTTMALSAASSSDALNNCTSFESESELSLAQEDLKQLQSNLQSTRSFSEVPASARTRHTSTTPPARTLPPRLPVSMKAAASSSMLVKPLQMTTSVAPGPPLQCPPQLVVRPQTIVLPALLQRPRWHNVVHERYRASAPEYVDACAQVLRDIHSMWEECMLNGRRREEGVRGRQGDQGKDDGDSCFAKHVSELLFHAHTDALLVLLEGVIGIHDGGDAFADSTAPFHYKLILHLVDRLARRTVELSGKHMAHLSHLLLSCPSLLTVAPSAQNSHAQTLTAAQQEDVWNTFAFLCYATRRNLRRRQNVDSLEALLCGVYMRIYNDSSTALNGDRGNRASRLASSMRRCYADAVDGGQQRQYVCHLFPPGLMAKVRQAALCHLVHRCLFSGAPAHVGAAEAITEERVTQLLAWALLLAPKDMGPAVHAAVVHRLRRNSGLAGGGLTAGASPVYVESWRRLALRVEAMVPLYRIGGKRATASPNGTEVFQRLHWAFKDTDGWAVPSADRLLLATVQERSLAQKYSSVPPWRATEYVAPRGVETARLCSGDAAAQRVANGAAATLRAYAFLRWEPLNVSEAEQLLPDDAPLALSALHMERARRETRASIVERSIAKVCEDTIETAAHLPLHALCLAEVLCVRLLRSLHRWRGTSTDDIIVPPASSGAAETSPAIIGASQQRRILAALRQLLTHLRAEGAMVALLGLQGEARNTAATGRCSSEHVQRDPSRTAPPSAPIWPSMPQRTWWLLSSAMCQHAEDAVRAAREWMVYREMMATPLSLASIQRVCEWLVALPGPMHSSRLVTVLREWAEMEKNKLNDASSLGQECLMTWDDVVRTAQEQHAAQALLAVLDGQCTIADATAAPYCSPCGEELRRTYAIMMGPTSAQLRRLQWIAEANSSAVREWRWNVGVASPQMGRATVSRPAGLLDPTSAVPAAVLLVEATEVNFTDTEHEAAVRLLRWRCLSHLSSPNTFSWSDRLACRALQSAQAASSPTTQLVANSDEVVIPDRSSAADGDANALPHQWKHDSDTIVSAAALHYLLSRWNRMESSAATITAMFSTAELNDALQALAVYVEFLEKPQNDGVDEGQCGERARIRRLRCAAAAYVDCLSDAWRATMQTAASTTSTPSLGRFDVKVFLMCLPTLYQCALEMHDRLLRNKAELGNGDDEVLRSLPCLSGPLHEAAFRALVNSPETQRDTIETTLLLADHITRRWPVRTKISPFSSRRAHSSKALPLPLSDGAPTFSVPLSVYRLVLATYAATRTPLPQRIRVCCEAALRRERKRVLEEPL
ncbi:hypothetical protein MNV84_04131 [Leishmania braziliensis]|nr:hypothetical protein MNV84_04131 [Leishmania braziliensis]